MSQAARTGFWRSVRQLPERTPLRVKLITAVLALVIVALAGISFAGITYIKGYLLNRADSQLEQLAANQNYGYGPRGPVNLGPQIGERSLVEAIAPTGQAYPAQTFRTFYQLSATDPKIPASVSWLASHAGKPVTVSAEHGRDLWRVIVQPRQQITLTDNQTFTGTVVTGVDVTDVYATITRLEGFDILLSVGIVLILALLATAAVRASLRPLTDIEETAGAIAAGDLSKRVPDHDPRTEVGRLSRSLNVMLGQIESAFRARSRSEESARRSEERMRQFVGDASHELRTPLTAIRGFAEYYRQRGGVAVGEAVTGDTTSDTASANGGGSRRGQLASADMDRIMRRVEQEAARMGILVEDMLLLARLDQQRPLAAHPVDLLTLAADAVHDARVVAPARNIDLTVSSGTALLVIGDEVRLRQVIGNLMSNALTHTPDGTPIDVLIRSGNLDEAAGATAAAQLDNAAETTVDGEPEPDDEDYWYDADEGDHWDAEHIPPPPGSPSQPAEPQPAGPAAVLEVTDHGPGLTREQAGHVFERFYRADPARSAGGTGLGLAIVAALVGAHGGTCWVRSRPGEGATFCIALPLSPDAMHGAPDDFDGDADDVVAETGAGATATEDSETEAAETEAPETEATETGESGTGQSGPSDSGRTATHRAPSRPADPGPAYTAGSRAELGS